MADTVRDVIRAAQQAEIGGDKRRAIELFQRAAELCQRAGNTVRAGQLLRYALRLDPSRADLRDALARLEELEAREALSPAAVSDDDDDETGPMGTWELEEDGSSLLEALREAELAVERRANPVELAVTAMRKAVAEVPRVIRREDLAPHAPPEEPGRFIERGPTRADPSLDAWCSFCCRPRAEVGALVAGPAGAFICAACIGESGGLLGGVTARPPGARSRAPARPPEADALLGQGEAQAALERGLAGGVRRILVLGPEGSGKSTWLRQLARRGLGELVGLDALEHASGEATLLLEDVDRLSPAEQAALGAFLERQPQRGVVMTGRGVAGVRGPELISDTGRLVVPTTASLAEATRGALPLALLERVQWLVTIEPPGEELLRELARRELEAREDCHLSDEALLALAREAARSPRLGHELKALLARLPPGSWGVGKETP